jgi:hypothetical protein
VATPTKLPTGLCLDRPPRGVEPARPAKALGLPEHGIDIGDADIEIT